MFQLPKFFNINSLNKIVQCERKCNYKRCIRRIMSKSYQCIQEWENRLSSNVLSSIDTGELFRNLKKTSDEKGPISSLDIDILTNKMSQLEESSYDLMEQILYNYRHSSEATGCLPSTPHALIRTLLHIRDYPRLMKMLTDKIHYGIFLDQYTSVLLLDHFLDANMQQEALQVVIDLMLQEELEQPIVKHLCYFTIHQHLHPLQSIQLTPLPTIDQNLDVVYRKVFYIQNPYYDQHFDLYDDQLKIGKALVALTRGRDDVISRGYHVVGLVLFQQFSKALEVLEAYAAEGEGAVICRKHLDLISSGVASLQTRDQELEVAGPGHKRLLHCVPSFTPTQKDTFLNQLKDIEARLEDRVEEEEDFEEFFAGVLKEAKEQEQALVQQQCNTYQEWTQKREAMMTEQISSLKDSQEKARMAEKILELKESEERLRFYEQRVQMALEMSKQRPYPKVKENVAEELYVLPPGERRADRKKK